ncbi:unnamed protein product [Caenorhabditis brenneri]
MIDVHCHLVDNKFKDDLDDVIKHALSSGVQKMINVPEFESQFEKSIEITKEWNKIVYTGIGIHPIQKRGKSAQMKHVAKMEQFLVKHENDVICVGECGLDHTVTQFKLTQEDFEEQERVFRHQIDLAKHFNKPLNVHSRSAARRTLEVLKECNIGPDQVVLHAFDGTQDDLKAGVDCGFLFSLPPSFERSGKAEEIIRSVPLHQLLLETDSPALGPEKGVKNVPANLKISTDVISKIRQISAEDVINATSSNAARVFRFL